MVLRLERKGGVDTPALHATTYRPAPTRSSSPSRSIAERGVIYPGALALGRALRFAHRRRSKARWQAPCRARERRHTGAIRCSRLHRLIGPSAGVGATCPTTRHGGPHRLVRSTWNPPSDTLSGALKSHCRMICGPGRGASDLVRGAGCRFDAAGRPGDDNGRRVET